MELHVFTNKTDWVIAADVDDAWRAWEEHSGEERADYDTEWTWDQLAPTHEITIWCDAEGDPCEPEEDGSDLITRAAAEWIAAQGRGFLCSTEY